MRNSETLEDPQYRTGKRFIRPCLLLYRPSFGTKYGDSSICLCKAFSEPRMDDCILQKSAPYKAFWIDSSWFMHRELTMPHVTLRELKIVFCQRSMN